MILESRSTTFLDLDVQSQSAPPSWKDRPPTKNTTVLVIGARYFLIGRTEFDTFLRTLDRRYIVGLNLRMSMSRRASPDQSILTGALDARTAWRGPGHQIFRVFQNCFQHDPLSRLVHQRSKVLRMV